MSNRKYNTVPTFNINVPNGGMQGPRIVIPQNQPVFSSYTGKFVTNGPVPYGVQCDAPIGNPNYGKNFHVVEFNPVNRSFMAHRITPNRK